MARKPILKNRRTLSREFKERLQSSAGITHWGYDSAARSLSDALAAESLRLNEESNRAFKGIQLSTATGKDLDNIAATYGVSRLPATFARTNMNERNFYFYVEGGGTFGSINGGSSITVGQGTEIYLGGAVEGTVPVLYKTTQPYILPASSSIKYCTIVASTAGPNQNVGSSTLRMHNVTGSGLTCSALLCRNKHSILNGRSVESDKNLRARTSRQYGMLAGATTDTLKVKGYEVPGVLTTRVEPNYFGIGTSAIFIFGAENESNSGLAQAVQERLDQIQTPGLLLVALPGVRVYLDFVLTIITTEELSLRSRGTVKRKINQAIQAYITSLAMDRRVNLRHLKKKIMNYIPEAIGVAETGTSERPFDAVYTRRNYAGLTETLEREEQLGNIILLERSEYPSVGTIAVNFETEAE